MQAWFRDTPVRIVEAEDGGLAVTVPREFSFNPGRSEVRPPLAAVLDKVAESLRRSPTLRLSLLAAPGDGSARSVALALERARQVQRHLRSRGVAPARLGTPTGGAAAAMQLRLADGSASP